MKNSIPEPEHRMAIEELMTLSCDETPRFELLYNGAPIFVDLTTLLQCLKVAECCHFIPPLDASWWIDITRRYPVEIDLDGRIQTERE